MRFYHVDFEALLPGFPSSLSALELSVSHLQDSLSPKDRKLMEAFHLGMSVPRPLALCILSGCGSLCLFSSAEGGSFSDDG